MVRFFATFLKKGSAKNFPCGKDFGAIFKKSTLDGCCQSSSVFYYAIEVRGFKFDVTNIEFGCRHCRPSVIFLKTPKNLSARKFFAELFFKKAT